MAKVFKAGDAAQVLAADLEEFPQRDVVRPGFPGTDESAAELDPQALRNAVLAEARAEAEQKIQQAYHEAFQRGLAAGRADFEASIGRAAESLESAADAMRQAREEFLDSLEPQVVQLVCCIAESVLQREVRSDPELIHHTVRRALGVIADRQRVLVRVHPQDFDALRTHKISLLEDFSGVEELDVEADEACTPGGCILESRLAQADARIETLLANVLEALGEAPHASH